VSAPRRAVELYALFAAGAFTFALLAVLVAQGGPLSLDLAIELGLQRSGSPTLDWLMVAVSWPGYTPQSVVVTLAAAAAVIALTRRGRDGLWLISTQLATAIAGLIKVALQRPRPTEELVRVYAQLADYGFPSGHVVFYTTLLGFAAFLMYVHRPGWPGRRLVLALSAALICLIGVSRVYLGYHWPSDVLGGYALSAALLVPYCALYTRLTLRGAAGPAATTAHPGPLPAGEGADEG
jgi:undecaprenyl-diphosphatase